MTLNGDRRHYATIEPGKTKSQRTRPGAVWQIAEATGAAKPLGFFRVDDRVAKAIVPK